MVALTIFASLNRETGVLLPLLYLAYFPTRWRQSALLLLLWAGVTIGLHIALGAGAHVLGLQGTLDLNMAALGEGLLKNALYIPLWLAVVLSYRRASTLHKRLMWIAVGYAGLVIVGGLWAEAPRLLIPALVLVLPVVLGESGKR